MPYGSFNGVVAIALPYLLRRHGTSVERIASIEAIVQAPAIWYVLWAPAVDLALRRRTWIVLLSVATAVCTVTALGLTTSTLRAATALFVVASVFNQPVSSALGALVASVVPNAERGRTAGWSQAGILGGGVLTGGLVVWLGDHTSTLVAALVAGALIGLPAFVALLVHEPAPHVTARRQQLKRMWRQLASTVRRRDVWLGFVFFLSPVSAGALMNLFSGVAPDFHASADQVIAVAAIGGVMLTLGALIAGALLDRVSRWRMYPVIGLLTGASLAVIAARALASADVPDRRRHLRVVHRRGLRGVHGAGARATGIRSRSQRNAVRAVHGGVERPDRLHAPARRPRSPIFRRPRDAPDRWGRECRLRRPLARAPRAREHSDPR